MVNRPIGKDSPSVDKAARHGAEYTRVIGTNTVVAHHKIHVSRHANRAIVAHVFVLRRDIGFRQWSSVNINNSLANLNGLARQAHHALDKGLRAVQGVPKHNYVAPLDGLKAVYKLVDEDALLVREQRRHAGAFDLNGLIQEDDNDQSETDGNEQIARPDTNFCAQSMCGRRPRRQRGRGREERRSWTFRDLREERVFLVRAVHFWLPCIYNMGIAHRAIL